MWKLKISSYADKYCIAPNFLALHTSLHNHLNVSEIVWYLALQWFQFDE